MNSQINSPFDFPANLFASSPSNVTAYKWNDEFFFLNMKVQTKPLKLHKQFYVQMLGAEEECKNYTVEIYLKDKTGMCAITFCDNPLPVEITEEDLKAGGIHVSHTIAKKICFPTVGESERLSFSVWLTFATETLGD